MSPRRIHPREEIVEEAETKLRDAISEVSKMDITWGEYIRAISNAFGDALSRAAKYMIRQERHPDDPDKPGGIQ